RHALRTAATMTSEGPLKSVGSATDPLVGEALVLDRSCCPSKSGAARTPIAMHKTVRIFIARLSTAAAQPSNKPCLALARRQTHAASSRASRSPPSKLQLRGDN